MKTIYIHRHAKSSWDHPGLSDFDRPLNSRGLKDAPMMGQRLKDRNEAIDGIVSSPAVRALSTAKLVAAEIGFSKSEIVEVPKLYHPSVRSILEVINSLNDELNSVMLFGHNPGFTEMITYLCDYQLFNLPTAGVACIDFPFEQWGMVSGSTGQLRWIDFPKNGDD